MQSLVDQIDAALPVIYPVVAVVVLLLITLGIVQSLRPSGMSLELKNKLKREVVHALRRNLAGMTAETLARQLGVETLKLLPLLEQMQEDGMLESFTNTQRLTLWRLKGIGP